MSSKVTYDRLRSLGAAPSDSPRSPRAAHAARAGRRISNERTMRLGQGQDWGTLGAAASPRCPRPLVKISSRAHMGSPAIAALFAHAAFCGLLACGAWLGELRLRTATIFVGLWLAGVLRAAGCAEWRGPVPVVCRRARYRDRVRGVQGGCPALLTFTRAGDVRQRPGRAANLLLRGGGGAPRHDPLRGAHQERSPERRLRHPAAR